MRNPEENDQVAIPISMNMGLESNEIERKSTNNISCQSPEISKFSPNKPPKHPTPDSPLIRKRTFQSNTRFGEPELPLDSQTLQMFQHSSSFPQNTPKSVKKDGPDEKEIYQRVTSQLTARNRKRMTVKCLLQFIVFLFILGCLLSSLSIKHFKGKLFSGVQVWKWFVILMVTFSGMLLTQWFVHLIVFFIEWKFLLKKNVVYFTHGLQNNVVVFIWIGVVLATWCLLLKPDVRKTRKAKSVLDFITWTLITLLIGSFLWLLKTTLMKILASSFHLNRFFERIQEAVFHHYVLQTLSGRPVVELSRKISKQESSGGQVSFTENTGNQKEKKVIDWAKLHQMKQEKYPVGAIVEEIVTLTSSEMT